MHELVRELFPICRSITGDGVRETLELIGERRAARDPRGADRDAGPRLDRAAGVEHPRRLDRRARRASASSTSAVEPARPQLQRPGRARLPLAELKEHLHSLPEQPDWIPYRTSYYERELGLLPRAPAPRVAPGGRVRGLCRLDARGRLADLRARLRRRARRRTRSSSPTLRLPPVARERQPLGHRRSRPCSPRHLAGQARRATRTASSSARARSARSRGSRGTRSGSGASGTGSCVSCVGDPGP